MHATQSLKLNAYIGLIAQFMLAVTYVLYVTIPPLHQVKKQPKRDYLNYGSE